jgi:hypothetical protein
MRAITIITFILCLSFTGTINAQSKNNGGGADYNTGIGIRFGYDGGASIKHFIKENAALEGILSAAWGYRGFRLTGLYEVHKQLPNAEGFKWYFGGGAHVGFYDGYYWNGYHNGKNIYYYDRLYTIVGVDGILGLEYKFEDAPFTLGLDVKPYVNLWGWGSHFWDGGFSARYVF